MYVPKGQGLLESDNASINPNYTQMKGIFALSVDFSLRKFSVVKFGQWSLEFGLMQSFECL